MDMDDPLLRSMFAYLSATVGLAFALGLYVGWALWKWLPGHRLGSRLGDTPPLDFWKQSPAFA